MDADELTLVNPVVGDDTCMGPNHGKMDTIPKGYRQWRKGVVVSCSQRLNDTVTHNVFCGMECFCDWHGWFEAVLQGNPGEPIPGNFALVWVTPSGTKTNYYDDWAQMTERVGEYQRYLVQNGLI